MVCNQVRYLISEEQETNYASTSYLNKLDIKWLRDRIIKKMDLIDRRINGKIPLINLKNNMKQKKRTEKGVLEVLQYTIYNGKTKEFEKEFSEYLGVSHLYLGNGTDALVIALQALELVKVTK